MVSMIGYRCSFSTHRTYWITIGIVFFFLMVNAAPGMTWSAIAEGSYGLGVEREIELDSYYVNALAWSHNGEYIAAAPEASGGADRIRVWETGSGERRTRISGSGGGAAYDIGWTPDNAIILKRDSYTVWDLDDGFVRDFEAFTDESLLLAPYVDPTTHSKWFAVSTKVQENATEIHLYDVLRGRLEANVTISGYRLEYTSSYGSALSPNGERVAISVSSKDVERILVYDIPTKTVTVIRSSESRLALSPDGSMLVSAGFNHPSAHLWDTTTGAMLDELPTANKYGFETLAWSPDGEKLATSGHSDDNTEIWDPDSGKRIETVEGQLPAWSSDGRKLATYILGIDSSITIWSKDSDGDDIADVSDFLPNFNNNKFYLIVAISIAVAAVSIIVWFVRRRRFDSDEDEFQFEFEFEFEDEGELSYRPGNMVTPPSQPTLDRNSQPVYPQHSPQRTMSRYARPTVAATQGPQQVVIIQNIGQYIAGNKTTIVDSVIQRSSFDGAPSNVPHPGRATTRARTLDQQSKRQLLRQYEMVLRNVWNKGYLTETEQELLREMRLRDNITIDDHRRIERGLLKELHRS